MAKCDCGNEIIGNASGKLYCSRCAFIRGELCSECGYDAGNGAGGYSNCCGAPLMGPRGSGSPIEIDRILILGTFKRHTAPPIEITQPVLEKLEWDPSQVFADEIWVDDREELDFTDSEYLSDALERAQKGIAEIDFSKYSLVICNFTGFNPTSFKLTTWIGSFQSEIAQTGNRKSPLFWAVHYDRDRGYIPYEIGFYNRFLQENCLTWR